MDTADDNNTFTRQASQPVAQASLGNDEFPVPFERYAASLVGTDDAVFLGHLRIQHGRENHKMSEWAAMLDGHRDTPAHPEHPEYRG